MLNSSKQNVLSSPLYLINNSVTDWNSLSTPGWYTGHSASNSHSDFSTGWVQALSLPRNNNQNYMHVIAFDADTNKIFCRTGTAGGSWNSWDPIKTWETIKGTVTVSSNKAAISFNAIPIDSGIVNVSYRFKSGYSGGGSAVLNVGYFIQLINHTSHNEVTGFSVSGTAGSATANITFSSVSNGSVLRYVISYCAYGSIQKYNW